MSDEPNADTSTGPGARLAMLIAGVALFGFVAWALLPEGTAVLLILGVALPSTATLVGKASPGPAQLFGWIFLATPAWLGAIMWHTGDLAWTLGEHRPLEALITWIAFGFMSLMGMVIGGSLIAGAKHTGRRRERAEALMRRRKSRAG